MVKPVILEQIHEFWVGTLDGREASAGAKAGMWFRQNDETDETIRQRFGHALAEAAGAEAELESLSRSQQVGLVILLDQFPRNLFRKSAEAFAYDDRARELAGRLIAGGIERFYLEERAFILLPLMHSEDIADQDRCVMLFAAEAVNAPEAWQESFRNGLDFATKHRDLIRRFGRFPHRNAVLGRSTTPEEEAFLRDHGRGF
jgi:uncharacterized protein (DUF924 family)